jgi:hypothetical protein
MKAKRAYLTDREHDAMWDAQDGLCGCGCGISLNETEGVIGEHVWLMVALGNDGKPDKLYRHPCADKKTNGLCGDKWRVAKVKRHREGRTQYDKRKERGFSLVRGRGFDKTLSKKFDGTVEKRNGR